VALLGAELFQDCSLFSSAKDTMQERLRVDVLIWFCGGFWQ